MLECTQRVDGDVAECGVFRGETLIPIGIFLSQNKPQSRVLGFDSFEGFDDTVDFTITCNRTGEGLWTESNVTAAKVVAPTKAVQDLVGIDRAQFDYVWCVGSKIRIVIAQGGNVTTAVFEIVVF